MTKLEDEDWLAFHNAHIAADMRHSAERRAGMSSSRLLYTIERPSSPPVLLRRTVLNSPLLWSFLAFMHQQRLDKEAATVIDSHT